METPDDFVVLLRSSNATLVDQVAALLEAEGIPYEHPGRNHAALLPGFTYIEIQLRVPRSRYEEATDLIAVLRSSSSSGKIAFRVRRTQMISGTFAGLGLGMVATIVAAVLGLHNSQAVAGALLGGGILGGFLYGSARNRDHCSVPTCGRRLQEDENTCPKCRATLRGVIKSDRDHLSAVESIEALEKKSESASADE